MRGLTLGIAATATLAHVLFLSDAQGMREVYGSLGTEIPVTTRITLSLAWMWGVPVACALAVAALLTFRPGSLVPYVVVAGAFVAALLATWHFPSAPFRELAEIKP